MEGATLVYCVKARHYRNMAVVDRVLKLTACLIQLQTLFGYFLKFIKQRKPRRWWVKPIVGLRDNEGVYALLLNKGPSHGFLYRKYLRVSETTFGAILRIIEPSIAKSDTRLRCGIPSAQQLAVTLHYLASGNKYFSYCMRGLDCVLNS